MASDSRITPLHDWHAANGGKMVQFAGWDMPVEYKPTGIAAEHVAVRTSAGIFDVSHMGRFYISGKNALDMLQFVLTNDSSQLKPGQAQYSFLVKHGEGARPLTLDDVYLYMLAEEEYALVVNAANAEQDFNYLSSHAKEFGVTLLDATQQTSLISVQGPASRQTLEQLVGRITLEEPNLVMPMHFGQREVLVSTTGYTGEFTRFEVFAKSEDAADVWNAAIEAGAVPCGLGARNTLRIEAGLLLFGHDISSGVSPIEAGMGFAVKPGKADAMIWKDFYEWQKKAAKEGNLGRYLVQLELSMTRQVERREGSPASRIIFNGEEVGEITSSTVAPMVHYRDNLFVLNSKGKPETERRGIALGYSRIQLQPGTEVGIIVRGAGEPVPAVVMRELLDKRTPLMIEGRSHTTPVSHYYR